jgi:taurine dioxygenase
MGIEVRRLAYGLGAEVFGVDMRKEPDGETIAAVRRAWLDHHVLVFHDQDLTIEQHIAFSRSFGELERHPEKHLRHERFPEIFEITNRSGSETGNIGRQWHSDGAFTLQPPSGSLLHCLEIPAYGGDTWFTNMYMAYDRLSEKMKTVVSQLEVVNDLAFASDLKYHDPTKTSDDLKEIPPVVQPMVRTHPETGRKALYLNETVTRHIEGMSEEESEGLLDFLFQHSIRAEFTYRHRWRKFDVVMWDNRCTMHLAPADYDRSQLRHMRRTTLCGTPSGRLYEARA